MRKLEKNLYFAYGSNMNLDQMALRCPQAEVVGPARLEGYRLAFRGNGYSGVATVLPQPGSCVEGVLWKISARDEMHLDYYEGYPRLYGKEMLSVTGRDGQCSEVMVYTMNSPYRDTPAIPSRGYLDGILTGYRQNGLETQPVKAAANAVRQEMRAGKPPRRTGQER